VVNMTTLGARAVALVALVSIALAGCGGAGGSGGASRPSARRTGGRIDAVLASGVAHTLHGLRGDEDDDDQESMTWGKVATPDADVDSDDDARDNRGKGYYDGDDGPVRHFGRAATPGQTRALAAVTGSYLQAASAANGGQACSLMAASTAGAAAQYGGVGGPPYLHGARGCKQVMTRLFGHDRSEFVGSFEKVVAARVAVARAYVLLGSLTRAARLLSLERVGGAWKVQALLPVPLP
jgi:hypothetical protein